MFRARARHQEVKIALHSLWYHHIETSEWYKIIKIQFYKYEQVVVKFLCLNFSGVITNQQFIRMLLYRYKN